MGVLPDWMIESGVKIEPMTKQEKRPGKISYGVGSYGYDARVGPLFKLFNPNKLLNSTGSNVIDPKTFNNDCLDVVDLTPFQHDIEPFGGNAYRCKRCDRVGEEKFRDGQCLVGGPPKPNFCLIPPHSFALCETVEYIEIPRDVLCIVVGKSTYARCGIQVMCTPLEPEWKGKVTIEIANTTPCPAKIYVGEGIMQLMFFRTDGEHDLTRKVFLYYLDKMSQVMAGSLAAYSAHAYDQLRVGPKQTSCRTSYADKQGIYQNQKGLTLPTVSGETNAP